MYKVFVNNRTIHFVKNINERIFNAEDTVILRFYSKKLMMDSYYEFINNKSLMHLYIYNPNGVTKAFNKFCDDFKVITAGGGLVKDSKTQKYLFIFRRGKWDLPKGKQDKGEEIRKTSVREVEEETGIDKLEIKEKLLNTYHIYIEKKTILKKTSWYLMQTTTDIKPVPQIAEDITEVKWMDETEIDEVMANTYPSIKLLVDLYFKKNRK